MFGNDFLPRLSFLHFDDDVYKYLYKCYLSAVIETQGQRIITRDDETNKYNINYDFLKYFLRILG